MVVATLAMFVPDATVPPRLERKSEDVATKDRQNVVLDRSFMPERFQTNFAFFLLLMGEFDLDALSSRGNPGRIGFVWQGPIPPSE